MVPDLNALGFAVAVAAVALSTLVVILDSRYRTGIVDWWYGDREAWWEKKTRDIVSTMAASRCALCGKPCTLRCGKCKAVKYCSKDCQLQHWKQGHKKQCKAAPPHEVQNDGQTSPDASSDPEVVLAPRQMLYPYSRFLKCFSDPDVFERKAPVGLRNLGNTCFANSVLQCLLHTRGLASYFRSQTHGKNCIKPSKHSFCLLCAMENLMCEYLDASAQECITPKQLMQRLPKIAKHMVLGRQEDAHEFYVHLVDVMEAIMLVEVGGKEMFDQRTQETTFVHHLFGGYVRNRIVCGECGRESKTFESTMQLELAISTTIDSIETALKRHFQDEVLDGDNKYQCESCKKKVRAVRGQRLEVAPNVLVICLKRFDSGSYYFKNNKPVRYKELLDVGPYLAPDSIDSPSTCLYQLHGVVMHLDFMNSTGSGHYLSYVCPEGRQWYQCNDSVVRQINKEKALDPRAYMLFYTRQTPHTAPRLCTDLPLSKASGRDVTAHQLCKGLGSDLTDSPDIPGPQSHPIPEPSSRHLDPPPCHTPSPSKPHGAAMSFDTAVHESSGDESASCGTTVAAPEVMGEVSSRPLHGDMSSTSESTEDEAAYSDYLMYCVKEGNLGQPGVVKLLLNLGAEACRGQDVQVAMSGMNHIVVHVPSRVPLDLNMGDGVVIDKLECSLVRKRNRLKITCTLAAADPPLSAEPDPATTTPVDALPAHPTSLSHPSDMSQPSLPQPNARVHPHTTADSGVACPHQPALSQPDSPVHAHESSYPAYTQPALSARQHPASSEPQVEDASSDTEDVSTYDQTGGMYDVLSGLPTSTAPVCPEDSEHDATEKDCWSWPASVDSECESLDLFRHPHHGLQMENDQSTSSCNSTLGAHPLSSAAASESPCDSDQLSPADDALTTTPDHVTHIAGKKRRIKQPNATQQSSNSQVAPAPPLQGVSLERTMSNQNGAGPNHSPVPATPTRTALLTGTTIEVSIDPARKVHGVGPDADALSVASDSDSSQEKNSDESLGAAEAGAAGAGSAKPAAADGKAPAKKPKNKAGKTKGKKKKARKH